MVSLIVFGSDELFRVGEGTSSEMVSFSGIVGDIQDKIVCPVCGGSRLNKDTTYFKIDGKTISEVSAMEITQLQDWLASLDEVLGQRESRIARDILKELKDRVRFLLDVGLDYLSLDRPTASLSGGESQRIRLATQIGSKLVNVLYILDEPTTGLHTADVIIKNTNINTALGFCPQFLMYFIPKLPVLYYEIFKENKTLCLGREFFDIQYIANLHFVLFATGLNNCVHNISSLPPDSLNKGGLFKGHLFTTYPIYAVKTKITHLQLNVNTN